MISRSKQTWTPGAIVKVGFLSLKVVKAIPTPGDGLPDQYELTNKDGTRTYLFTPYNGLERVS